MSDMSDMSERFNLEQSLRLYDRACSVIASGSQTLSKRPELFAPGAFPAYIVEGKGSHVWDVDGNEYIDFIMALGPVNLGYCYPRVNEAIREQVNRLIISPLLNPLEVEVAELLVECIPCAEMVRFMKSGAEAMSACVRLARAYTGRELLLHCGYHGWHDTFAASSGRVGVPKGLSKLVQTFPYNDPQPLEEIMKREGDRVAAIVIEPRMPPRNDFLHRVREIADRYGAVLIFDEIVTGFRLALGGSQEYHGVTPDLAAFAKGVANGMPLAVVCGKKQIMRLATEAVISTTYGGEALSLAAAKATITELKEKDVFAHTWRMGEILQRGWVRTAEEVGLKAEPNGYPPIGAVEFILEDRQLHQYVWTLFLQEMAKRGVLLRRGGLNFICYSHSEEDIDFTLSQAKEVLEFISDALRRGTVKSALETVSDIGQPIRRF